jgi:nicotinamide-nucleotide amidase
MTDDASSHAAIERAAIVSCGDELTTGRIADTNAAFLASSLGDLGIAVTAVLVVGDDPEHIVWAWQQAMAQADVVIATGGLGPTADDLTTETLARMLDRPLVRDEAVAERIRKFFAAVGRNMPSNNLKQADFPAGATVIDNPVGTAPGYRLMVDEGRGRTHLIVMPGVPREMKRLWSDSVGPWLRETRGGDRVFVSRVFQTFGLSESGLDERLQGAIDPGEARLSFRASFPEISIKITVAGVPGQAEAVLARTSEQARARIADYVYGEGADSLESVVGRMLRESHLTLAVAESCTGGLIGHRITNVPGSSAYFAEGVVCYSNEAKHRLLGVRTETLDSHGAVSEEVAREMAVGVRSRGNRSLGLATTGIAGPDGGTEDKPVGTVCLALASEAGVVSRRYQLWGTRDWVKLLTSQLALDWVRRHLLGLPVTEAGIVGRSQSAK